MNLNDLVEKFISSPGYMDRGAGIISKRLKCSKETVYKAKERARQVISSTREAHLQNMIVEQEEELVKYMGSKTDTEGNTVKSFESSKPLTPAELKVLAGVDDITTTLGMVWDKLSPSGKWTYSIQVKFLISNFYTKEEISTKLKEIFPDKITPFKLPTTSSPVEREEALFVFIADDHVGLDYRESLFDVSYSADVYKQRVESLTKKILQNGWSYGHVFIVRLGDELDGYNAKTTRYDHSLDSLSNKEQFDTFTSVNKSFYDTIFSSGLGEEYTVINCNNSNHSGLGFSYMTNKAIEFYIEAKYPQVTFQHINEFIGGVEWGNHVIGLTHGKDEKYMKKPLPLNLDKDTDLFLFEYYDRKGYSPSSRWISTIKGDLHKYNVNDGKSGRYVNVPSIAGGSKWIEHNFGYSKPGALIEIYDKNTPDVLSYPVRL